ncbi:MAG: HTTM domain-containing protein, partial [Actinomycetota bacterium]|nr:HTTM domain-containing protein [Actinomycetota bacterium]
MGSSAPEAQAPEADGRWRFGLFSALLALSLILHQLWWDGFEVPGLHFVVVVAAFWVLVRPTSVARLLALLALEVVAVGRDMPGAGSHTLLAAVCGASILLYAVWTSARARRLPDAAAFFERIEPFLRVALIVLYAAAALAKMNPGYFDSQVSCAAAMVPSVVWFAPELADVPWLLMPAAWSSVLVEATLPLLLVLPRTRVAGLILGMAFHLVLALAGNVPFTSLVLAFYVAFLPPGATTRMRAVALARWPPWVGARAWPVVVATLAGLWVLGGIA